MNEKFSHEKLEVYQRSLQFVRYVDQLLVNLDDSTYIVDQLDRAASSIPLNISEGNGKYSKKDRCSYFDTARGSAFECSSCLDVMVEKELITEKEAKEGKEILREIISMLMGLIKNNSDRVYEQVEEYTSPPEP